MLSQGWSWATSHPIYDVSILAASLLLLAVVNGVTRRLWPDMHQRLIEAIPIPGDQSIENSRSLPLLQIQLRLNSFYPKEFRGLEGKYELLIINTTCEPDVSFQLQRERGGRVQTLQQKLDRDVRSVQNLRAGKYRLTVANRPELACEIHISGSITKS